MTSTWRKAVAGALVAAGVPCVIAAPPASASALDRFERFRITRFLGEQRLPHRMSFEGTTVGGLSGIDYDPTTRNWYFISDDRGRHNAPRFYRGRLDIHPETGAFAGVRMTEVTTLQRPDGHRYAPHGRPRSADPETIRFDPWSRRVVWGSEGDRPDAANPHIPLTQPFVRWNGKDGRHLRELQLPSNLLLSTAGHGPRRNYSIEGLALAPRFIAVMQEGPGYEDGPVPTVEHGATTRVTLWDRWPRRRLYAQYAYRLDRLPAAPRPAGGSHDSGVSEILAIDNHRYLALERSWIQGVGYRAKLYEFDTRDATNVLAKDSLAKGRGYRPVTKRLVRDLGSFRRPVQNLESLSWGPRLRSGECTLLIGSDDNFDRQEVTQFLLFAVRGLRGCP
ncbi:Uncharacterized conserved protein [Thermomonospora echinospora]|uniref:Uncharacterized conserved protein n=1 Tax=Thermomonospora echinospora TaxID=1992 RepID=A0A1H6E449_9ACTN|nr:esterase-like activity of phytase family protein [Thermomonospora echinospora]SEG92357.1 Uncharacterized conserved protein [Thermomonospora echinospora]